MSVEDHWSGTRAVVVASVGCVVERPLEGLLIRQVLRVRRPRAAGRRHEVTAKSQASGIVSFPWGLHTSAERSRPRQCPGEAGGDLLSLLEDRALLLWRRKPPRYNYGFQTAA